jgi:hypothetical protein
MSKIQAFTCYQNNISENIVKYQKMVFDLFGMNLIQEYTEIDHPEYLDQKINNIDFDILVFFDIDCIPLNPNLYSYIIDKLSDNNSILGVEQCNMKKEGIYAGPSCFGITKDVFNKLEKPSFKPTYRSDTAGEFTFSSIDKNVNVKLFNIKKSLNKKWKCGDKFFGNGTTYEDWLYHQFELGRYYKHPNLKIYEYQFINKCKEVIKKYENYSINNN